MLEFMKYFAKEEESDDEEEDEEDIENICQAQGRGGRQERRGSLGQRSARSSTRT